MNTTILNKINLCNKVIWCELKMKPMFNASCICIQYRQLCIVDLCLKDMKTSTENPSVKIKCVIVPEWIGVQSVFYSEKWSWFVCTVSVWVHHYHNRNIEGPLYLTANWTWVRKSIIQSARKMHAVCEDLQICSRALLKHTNHIFPSVCACSLHSGYLKILISGGL